MGDEKPPTLVSFEPDTLGALRGHLTKDSEWVIISEEGRYSLQIRCKLAHKNIYGYLIAILLTGKLSISNAQNARVRNVTVTLPASYRAVVVSGGNPPTISL